MVEGFAIEEYCTVEPYLNVLSNPALSDTSTAMGEAEGLREKTACWRFACRD